MDGFKSGTALLSLDKLTQMVQDFFPNLGSAKVNDIVFLAAWLGHLAYLVYLEWKSKNAQIQPKTEG